MAPTGAVLATGLQAEPRLHHRDAKERFRASVRQFCATQIAPDAARTDHDAVFPARCYAALRDRGWHAPQVPGRYGGLGADAVSTAIVVEEVARCCATSALIPAINTIGARTLQSAATEPQQAAYLPRIARGEAMISFCLSEPEAGSDPQGMRTRAERARGMLCAERRQTVDHPRRSLDALSRLRGHRSCGRIARHLRVPDRVRRSRSELRSPGAKAGRPRIADPRRGPRPGTRPGSAADRPARQRPATRSRRARPQPGQHRRASGRDRPGSARIRHRPPASTPEHRADPPGRAPSSCSPTWPSASPRPGA